jgi:hypothetical protein
MDLEQIIGRQRLDTNPWKNSALMYVKCTDTRHRTSQEEFEEFLSGKIEQTERLLKVFNNTNEDRDKFALARNYQTVAKMCHYKSDYVAVSRIENSKGEVVRLQPTFNRLVLITEERAFELQQSDYADRFTVFASTQLEGVDSIEDEVNQKVEEFNTIKTVRDRLRFMVEYSKVATKENLGNFLELVPSKYKDYYNIVGPETIIRNSYVESEIKKAWLEKVSNEEVREDVIAEIYCTFIVGQRYTKKNIKEILSDLYEKLGYKKTAKATDLELYYYMKPVLTSDKKHGFELIGRR